MVDTVRPTTPVWFLGHVVKDAPKASGGVPSGNLQFVSTLAGAPYSVTPGEDGLFYGTLATVNRVVTIAPNGMVTNIAGSGTGGYQDGDATTAMFNSPMGACLGPNGIVYVADTYNYRIRKIENGVVSTLAGNSTQGLVDGQGAAASFYYPVSIVYDKARNCLYVLDNLGQIRRVTLDGVVTWVAGGLTANSTADGFGTAAAFYSPTAMNLAPDGLLYLVDQHTVRRINPETWEVKTVAGVGADKAPGSTVNGDVGVARFNDPTGVGVDVLGTIWVSERYSSSLRKIANGFVSTAATLSGQALSVAVNVDGYLITSSYDKLYLSTPIPVENDPASFQHVRFVWEDAVDDVAIAGYRIFYNDLGVRGAELTPGLITDDSYFYQGPSISDRTFEIVAYDLEGNSSTNNTIAIVRSSGGGAVLVAAPGNLRAGNVTLNGGVIQWDPVPVAVGYEVSVDEGQTSVFVGTALLYEVTGRQPGDVVKVLVRAFDEHRTRSDWATVEFTTVDNRPPLAPSGLRVSEVSDTQAKVVWDSPTDAAVGYETTDRDLGKVFEVLLTGMTPGQETVFRVRSYDANGNRSPWAELVVVTTGGRDPDYVYFQDHLAFSLPEFMREATRKPVPTPIVEPAP